jgi:hypothetical protein
VRLTDLARAFATITSNIALGALDFTAATMAAVTGETERAAFHLGQIANRGFLDGFEWTDHNELFIAPPVAISEWEKTLQSMVDGMNTSNMSDIETKFKDRMKTISEGLKNNPLENKIEIKPKVDTSAASGLNSEVRLLQAVESRVLVRGSTEDPLLSLSKEQVSALKELINVITRQGEEKQPAIVFQGVN